MIPYENIPAHSSLESKYIKKANADELSDIDG